MQEKETSIWEENLKRKREVIDNKEDPISRKKEEAVLTRLAEMNLNESEIEILKNDKTESAETKATLLYTEFGQEDHATQKVKE